MSIKQEFIDCMQDAVGEIEQASHQYLGKKFMHAPGRFRNFTAWQIIKILLIAQGVITLAMLQMALVYGRGITVVFAAVPFVAHLLKFAYRNDPKIANAPFLTWLIISAILCFIAWAVIASFLNFKPSPDISYKETRSDS